MLKSPFPLKKGSKKLINAWAFYDWANSAFATTVMAGFFPLFFKSFWATDLSSVESTAVIGTVNSITGLIIMVLAPILGAYSDLGKLKKKFLGFFVLIGVLSTGYLYFIPQGDWFLAAGLYTLAAIGFSGGNIFYDSLIVSVSREDQRNKVSSLGYSMGYLGGGLLFLINVLMYLNPGWFGLSSEVDAILWSFLSVAIWWAIFSIPLFRFNQFWGTYRGYRQTSNISPELKNHFYFPHGFFRKTEEISANGNDRLIKYENN